MWAQSNKWESTACQIAAINTDTPLLPHVTDDDINTYQKNKKGGRQLQHCLMQAYKGPVDIKQSGHVTQVTGSSHHGVSVRLHNSLTSSTSTGAPSIFSLCLALTWYLMSPSPVRRSLRRFSRLCCAVRAVSLGRRRRSCRCRNVSFFPVVMPTGRVTLRPASRIRA